MLEAATAAASEKLYDLLVDRCGSHVVRALLAALAGRAVEPARIGGSGGPGGGGAAAENTTDGAAFLRGARKPRAPASTLASRGGSGGSSSAGGGGGGLGAAPRAPLPPPPTRHAGLVARLARVVLSKDWESDLGALSYDGYAAPALQALLRAAKGDDELVCELVPRLLGAPPTAESGGGSGGGGRAAPPALPAEGARLALLTKDAVATAARDRSGSHLLEAVLEVSPRSLRTEFDARFLRGGFAPLAEHPSANFVVQAALGAADTPAAVRGAAKELAPVAGRLLAGSRGGVLLALVGAAGRVGQGRRRRERGRRREGTAEKRRTALRRRRQRRGAAVAAAAEAVAAALEKAADRASALLVLGEKPTRHRRRGRRRGTKKLSAVGCALLSSLLSLPSRQAATPYAAALAALPDQAFARVASDSAGSRAVEALFAGPGLGAKSKKAAGKKLAGRLSFVASTPGGVHAIERAFEAAGAGGRRRSRRARRRRQGREPVDAAPEGRGADAQVRRGGVAAAVEGRRRRRRRR